MNDGKPLPTSIRGLHSFELQALDAHAGRLGVSRSALVVKIVRAWLKTEEGQLRPEQRELGL